MNGKVYGIEELLDTPVMPQDLAEKLVQNKSQVRNLNPPSWWNALKWSRWYDHMRLIGNPFDKYRRPSLWLTKSPLPTAKDSIAASCQLNTIYCVGGRAIVSDTAAFWFPKEPSFYVYDISKNVWYAKDDMLFPHMANAIALAKDGRLFSFGGVLLVPNRVLAESERLVIQFTYDNFAGISNLVQSYSPLTTAAWKLEKPMPECRKYHAAVTAGDGCIYIFGGRTWVLGFPPNPSGRKVLQSTLRYDPETDHWSSVAPMPAPREAMAAVLGKDGLIYVLGGYGDDCKFHCSVDAYDPKEDVWYKKNPMPEPRALHAAVVAESGKIYVMGGFCGCDSLDSVGIYDPVDGSWLLDDPIHPSRALCCAAISEFNQIFVIGGIELNRTSQLQKLLASVIARVVK